MVFSYYTTVNWEENRELWVHGFTFFIGFALVNEIGGKSIQNC